jgi:hypothetical protein
VVTAVAVSGIVVGIGVSVGSGVNVGGGHGPSGQMTGVLVGQTIAAGAAVGTIKAYPVASKGDTIITILIVSSITSHKFQRTGCARPACTERRWR